MLNLALFRHPKSRLAVATGVGSACAQGAVGPAQSRVWFMAIGASKLFAGKSMNLPRGLAIANRAVQGSDPGVLKR